MLPNPDKDRPGLGDRSGALSAKRDTRAMWLLWLGVVFGFLVLATAWFFLVRAAREANVQSVPLATSGGKP